ncbi:MAG: T9SS type A sorting domain-containing protein [Roseivirga sp.]|nr:T9SS type A sorting domain-containing protein [Roseivirga sp.]
MHSIKRTSFFASQIHLDWDVINYPSGTTSGESYVITNTGSGPDVRVNIGFTGDLTHLTTYPETMGVNTPDETSAFSSAGGLGGGGNSLVIAMDPPSGSSSITMSLDFNFLQENVEFSIYDIDNFYSGDLNTSRRDSVRVIGYAGSLAVSPAISLINAASATLSITQDGDYGVGVGKAIPPTSSSNNDTKGSMDVVFNEPIDRIEIEYLEANSSGSNPGFRWISISDIYFDLPAAAPNTCASSLTTLDWATASFTSGSLNESVTVTNPGSGPDITFNFATSDDTGHLTNTTPKIDASFASSAGGVGGGGSTLRLDADAPLSSSSVVTTTITTSSILSNLRFSIYDLDSAYTGSATNAGIDSIRIVGYHGNIAVVPTLLNPNNDPTFTSTYVDVFGAAKGVPFNPSGSGPSSNSSDGTLDVYFELPVNKIVIEYHEANTTGGANPSERSIAISDIQFCAPVNEPVTCAISLSSLDWNSENYIAEALSGESYTVTNSNDGGADMTLDFTITGDTDHFESGFPTDNSTASNGGGEGSGDQSMELRLNPPASATSSMVTTSIALGNVATDVRFSIYDIDNSMSNGIQDSVLITGYNGNDAVVPVLIPVSSTSSFSITTQDQYAIATATDPATDDPSNNETKGSVDVYFTSPINRVEIVYLEANTGASDFGTRSISISDILFCSTSADVISCLYPLAFLDWGDVTYTSGATSAEFTVDNPASGGDVDFSFEFTGDNSFKDSTPLVNSDMNSAGGVANGDESLYMLIDPNSGSSNMVLTIDLNQTLADVRFSIFDIDNGVFGTGGVNSRQDSVRITGYNGNTEIAPSLATVDASPTFTVSSSGNTGIATALDFPPTESSSNDTKGTLDVFFTANVNKVQIEYLEGNVDGVNPVQRAIYLSDIYFCPLQGVLPVTFVSFDLSVSGHRVLLDWSTSEEINNSFFTVQRSTDGSIWENIALLPGAGNSQGLIRYKHRDENALYGTSYYRIRQTDFDGSSSYTEALRAEVTQDQISLNLKPNPSDEVLEIHLKGDLQQYIRYEVSNLQGQRQLSANIDRTAISLETVSLPSGIYLIRVYTKKGQISKKFIVKH